MIASWRFLPGILPFLILSICLLSCKGEITTGAPERCIHDLTGAVDIVFVMDRSTSVNSENFNHMHRFAREILKNTIISPDNARVAVISFGSNITTDVNYISRDNPVYECEFYHNLGAFNTQVRYVVGGSTSTTKPQNEEIIEALETSRIILEAGRNARRNVRQFMWIMTDYHDFKDSTSEKLKVITTTLKETERVILFGHGDGNDHNSNASEALQNVVSQPPRCYYDNQLKESELRTELNWEFIVPEKIRPGEWRDVTQAKICQEIKGCNSCRCEEFGEVLYNSTYQCVEWSSDDENGTDDHLWHALKFVFFGVGGLGVLVLIISLICYCCCCGRTTRRPEQEPPKAEGQEDKEEEPEDESNTENHYQNSIVVEIWNQATLDRQTRIPESDSPPTSPDYLEPISAPPSPPVSTTGITHQYLTQSREGNPQTRGEYVDSNARPQGQPPPSANGHCRPGRASNPSYGDKSPSVIQGSSFLEEFQKKWQQIRKTVVSTVRLKTNGKRHRKYENEGTIEDISRRFHDNGQNGSANPPTGALDEPTRSNNSQSESRKSGWSFWPFRRSTAEHYENEDTIEEISRRYHEQNGSAVQGPGASGGPTSNNNTNSQSESRKSGCSCCYC